MGCYTSVNGRFDVGTVPNSHTALVKTQCSECHGCGVADYLVDCEGDEWPVECNHCGGQGTVDVCALCGQAPDAWTDICGCASSKHPEVTWALSVGLCTKEQVGL